MARTALLLLLACLAAGCARPPRAVSAVAPVRPDAELARVIALAADQVKPCYRAPRGARTGARIVTTLRVAYAPDGRLAELPALLAQRGVTPDNAATARALAEAAARAVIACVPLRLPADRYRDGWDSFDLTFGPKAVA